MGQDHNITLGYFVLWGPQTLFSITNCIIVLVGTWRTSEIQSFHIIIHYSSCSHAYSHNTHPGQLTRITKNAIYPFLIHFIISLLPVSFHNMDNYSTKHYLPSQPSFTSLLPSRLQNSFWQSCPKMSQIHIEPKCTRDHISVPQRYVWLVDDN